MVLFKNKYPSFYSALIDKFCKVPIHNTDYVPQGICLMDKYLVISCYDCKHEKNSILFLCTKNSYKTIYLQYKIHCGGICYHKKTDSLYVTGEGIKNTSFIYRYCGKKLLQADNASIISFDKKFCVDDTCLLYSSSAKSSSPAFITCFDNFLFVGNFVDYKTKDKKGVIKKLKILTNGDLSTSYELYNNPYRNTQGFCVYEYKDITYYIFSRSFGRFRNSILNVAKLEKDSFVTVSTIVLPCMAEQVNNYYDNVMIIFESFASCYCYNAINCSKYVYVLDFESLLDCHDNYKCFCKGDRLFINNRGIDV